MNDIDYQNPSKELHNMIGIIRPNQPWSGICVVENFFKPSW